MDSLLPCRSVISHLELRCICAHKYYILGSLKVVGREIMMDSNKCDTARSAVHGVMPNQSSALNPLWAQYGLGVLQLHDQS